MIKSERIPYKVKMKLRAVLLDGETDEAVAIAAAINTWPGMECRPTFTPSRIILPLTQEKP
jgi:hypothetical protein